MSRVLLGSGGFRTTERITRLAGTMRSFFGSVRRLLFVPYALNDHDGYVRMVLDRGWHAGYELVGIHSQPDQAQAIREAQAIFIGGGNTFRLLDALYRLELLDVIRARVEAGVPYLGISAGSNVACPTIMTTNDMPIVYPPSFNALDLVPFQVNPHYYAGSTFLQTESGYEQHFGETRDDRIKEYHEMNARPVIGLWEAGLLRVEGDRVDLLGTPARVFRIGMAPVDVEPGTDLGALLNQHESP